MTPRFLAICLLITTCTHVYAAGPQHHAGHFEGKLVLMPLSDGINMQLQQPFSYTDWEGHTLRAPTGFITDGASIPRVAWSFIGGPWSGKYRAAAVIRDEGCVSHRFSWQITDRISYDAMMDLQTPKDLALTMYYAVLVGGPRWDLVATSATATADDLSKQLQVNKQKLDAAISQVPHTEKLDEKIMTSAERTTINGRTVFTGEVFDVYEKQRLTEDQLQAFHEMVRSREAAGRPVTPDEVEILSAETVMRGSH